MIAAHSNANLSATHGVRFARRDEVERGWRRRLTGPPFRAQQSSHNGPVRLGQRFSEGRLRVLAVEDGDTMQLPPRGHFLLSRRVSTRQRALNQEASRRGLGIFRHPGGAEEYLFDHVSRLRCRQSLAEKSERTGHVSVENFSKQLLLITECGVKTWAIDLHRARKIGKGRALITFGPENVHGAIKCIVQVEGARPSGPRHSFQFNTHG